MHTRLNVGCICFILPLLEYAKLSREEEDCAYSYDVGLDMWEALPSSI